MDKEMRQKSPHRAEVCDRKQDDHDDVACFEDSSGIDKGLQAAIRKVLLRKPAGVWASKFAVEFKEVIGRDLPLKSLGYLSVIDLMSALDSVKIERPCPRDWLLFDSTLYRPNIKSEASKQRSDERSSTKSTPCSSLSTAPPVHPEVKETILQVLLHHSPEGVLMKDLPGIFKIATGEDLDVNRLGFHSLDDLLLALNDITNLKYCGEGQVRVVPFNPGAPKKPEYVPNLLIQPADSKSAEVELPEDVVGQGLAYSNQPFPFDAKFVEVCVSNVESPHMFWLQLNGPNTVDALEDLMNELETCYYKETMSNRYIMPTEFIREGQVCAAIFPEDENWHRVTIVSIDRLARTGMVQVYFVDYGNTCEVHRDSLRLLRRRFLKLPAQAIRATLAYIEPADGVWTVLARNRLLEMVANRVVLAFVVGSNKNGYVSVCLCDTSGKEDLHINDQLVTESLAVAQYDVNSAAEASQDTEDSQPLEDGSVADLHTLEDGGDIYWSDKDSSSDEEDSESSESSIQLDLGELQTALVALQFKRKHILQSMMSVDNPEGSMTLVEELQQIEQQLSTVRERVQELKEQDTESEKGAAAPMKENTPEKAPRPEPAKLPGRDPYSNTANIKSFPHVLAAQQVDLNPTVDPIQLQKQTNIVTPMPPHTVTPLSTQPDLANMMSSMSMGSALPRMNPNPQPVASQSQQQHMMQQYQQLLHQAVALFPSNQLMPANAVMQQPLMLQTNMAYNPLYNPLFLQNPHANAATFPTPQVPAQAPAAVDMSAMMSNMAPGHGLGRGLMFQNLGDMNRPGNN